MGSKGKRFISIPCKTDITSAFWIIYRKERLSHCLRGRRTISEGCFRRRRFPANIRIRGRCIWLPNYKRAGEKGDNRKLKSSIVTLLSPAIVTDKYFVISDLYLKVISDNKKTCFILKREVCSLPLFRHGLHGLTRFLIVYPIS